MATALRWFDAGTDTSRGNRYENMVQLPILDDILYNLQRQGRIVFYVRESLPWSAP